MISIIIPLYNKERFIKETLKSLSGWEDVEIIIVDNNSTDRGREICEEIAKTDQRIRILEETQKGVSFARNKGLREAQGEYVCFLDADDLYIIERLKDTAMGCIETDADIAVFGYYKKDDQSGEQTESEAVHFSKGLVDSKRKQEYICELVRTLAAYNVSNKLYKSKMLKEYSLRFSEKMNRLEDFSFFMQAAAKAEKIYHDPGHIHIYRCNIAEGSLVWQKRTEYEYILECMDILIQCELDSGWKNKILAVVIPRELSEVRLHSSYRYYQSVCKRIMQRLRTSRIGFVWTASDIKMYSALIFRGVFWLYTRARWKVA